MAMSKTELEFNVVITSSNRSLAMLLVFSYQSLNMASWIFKPCIRHMGFTSGSNGSKLDTQQLLLSLFYAVEFSLIASHHPMILKTSLGELDFVPSDYQLIGQMLVFVMAEHLMQLFFMSFYSLYSIEKPMDASGLATDFSVQQTTLLIAIVFVQWPSKGDKAGKWLGELHILAIAGWILVQKVSQVSRRSVSKSTNRI